MNNNSNDLEIYLAAKNDEELVKIIAKEYTESGIPMDKLTEAGMIGICKAHENYDEEHGFNFNAYAIWWIRQQIKQTLIAKD